MNDRVLSISVGELILKGKNRKYFEDKLISNIKRACSDFEVSRIYKEQGKIYVEGNQSDYPDMIKRIKNVFGIVYVVEALRVPKNMDSIFETSILLVNELKSKLRVSTFKVEASRGDKSFEFKSPEIEKMVGSIILKEFGDISVDVHDPDFRIYVDVKVNTYVYSNKIQCAGGMPVGTNGQGLVLLSGGIDSPVSAYLMAKRGLMINAVHFHSYPFTSEQAELKVKKLAHIVSRYTGKMKLFNVNLLEIQKEIQEKCPDSLMTIISRRFMVRIAERISKKYDYQALITGESLGQVASQTILGLNSTNNATDMLILRPLIGMDKTEIIDIARAIDTYETSILPYEDCCTVFVAKHPMTQPKLNYVIEKESILDVKALVDSAIDKVEIVEID